MPKQRGLLGVANDQVIPVALDRNLAHVLADIDDLLGMGAFADQVPSTEDARDVAPFDVMEDRFERGDIAM